MNHKEKAEELVDKIYYCQRYADGEDYIPLEAYKRAKACALIAVDEVLNEYKSNETFTQLVSSRVFMYKRIKQEIEKL